MTRWTYVLVALFVCTASTQASWFKKCNSGCKGNGAIALAAGCNGYTTVLEARTIMVPEMVTEMQMVTVTENRTEIRPQIVTRSRQVPVTEQVPYTYTIMASETRSRTETYTEMVPVVTAQVQTYTVMVPYTETRTGTRKVARVVQVVVPQTVTRDMGHFEDRCVTQTVFAASAASSCSGSSRCGLFSRRRGGCHSSGCGNDCGDACGNGCGTSCVADCGPQISTVTQRVWVPNLVTVTENVTVSKIE